MWCVDTPGLPEDHPVTVAAKPLRLELLTTKAEVDGRLEELSLTWTGCGRKVHRVGRTPERTGIGRRACRAVRVTPLGAARGLPLSGDREPSCASLA
jgi:hypothetical protein